MKLDDIEAPPCQCPECFQAGVTDRKQRRDPRSGAWLHGQALRRWWDAHDEFLALKGKLGPKSMP
jgi:hypothetical protein